MLKKNKGITLVALIITIVVLLIIAVVAIGAVRDSSIIGHAEKAAKEYNSAKDDEQGELSGYEDYAKEHEKDGSGTGNVEDKIKNDFEMTVAQKTNCTPVMSVTLTIKPVIPDSWNEREFTEEDEDLAAQIVGDYTRLRINGERATNLKELIIAGVNDEYGDVLTSKLGKTFSKDDYDTMIPIMQSMLPGVDISTPQKAFEYMMVVMGKEYKTVQEFAEDVYKYEPTTCSLKIRKRGGEWTDITDENNWKNTNYQVEENGKHEIQMELDGKKSTKTIEVNSINENVLWTEAKSENQTFSGATTGSSKNPIIPAGFRPMNTNTAKWDAANGPEVDNGLVIVDDSGNEFVWVPVEGDISTIEYVSSSAYREPTTISLENWHDDKQENLEKANCEDIDKNGVLELSDFEAELKNMYLEMSTSVNKYDGFYVGRYETSMNGENPQSKASTPEKTIKSVTDWDDKRWYELYALNKKYNTSSVQGSMMWGIQYDKMMTWMGDASETRIEYDDRNKDRTCGTAPNDVIKNVYDIYGSSSEWTIEAAVNKKERVFRGR